MRDASYPLWLQDDRNKVESKFLKRTAPRPFIVAMAKFDSVKDVWLPTPALLIWRKIQIKISAEQACTMEKWQGRTLSMSEDGNLVCTYSGANSCKEVRVCDYGYVCWIKWTRLFSLLKKIGRQDRSDDLSHIMPFSQISSLIQYLMKNQTANEDSTKRDRSLGIRSPSNACQIVTVGVYHPHAATFVMHASLRIRATGEVNALTLSSIVHSFACAPG